MDVGSNFLGSSSPSLVSLSFSLSVQTPSAAQTANRGRKKRAKTFLPSSSLARPQFVRPSVRVAFFLPDDDDDDDEGGGGGGGGDDAL